MDHPLTRRGLLGGMGAAAGVAALGATLPVTAAGATGPGAVAAPPDPGRDDDLDPTAPEPLTPGLAYQMVDAVAFTPRDSDSAWPRAVNNQGAVLNAGGALSASINVP